MINWPSDVAGKIAAIKSVWEPGLSQAQIAARLGVERNAVIGVFNRNPQLKIDCPPNRSSHLFSPSKRKLIGYAGQEPPKRLNATPQLTVERVSAPPPISEPSPLNCALVDIPAGGCHWPVSDSPFTFCGNPASGTYCDFHTRLGHGSGSPSERRAERVLRAEML